MSDSEQCSNRLELDIISLLVNFSCELGPIMTRYDFLWARWVILINVRTHLNLTWYHFWSTFHVNWGKLWPDMTSYGLDEWFWAMFEPTWNWPNLHFWSGFHYVLDEWLLAMFETTCFLPNFTFCQLFMWIEANNEQITGWLPMG